MRWVIAVDYTWRKTWRDTEDGGSGCVLRGCPKCGGEMKTIAFINAGEVIRDILGHLGEPVDPPRMAPECGQPLREAVGEGCAVQTLPEICREITVDDGWKARGIFRGWW